MSCHDNYVYAVQEGQVIYSPDLVRHMLTAEKNPLTPREMEILVALDQGFTTQAIADSHYLALGTIRNYISSILSKTGSQSRIEAINVAKDHGWL